MGGAELVYGVAWCGMVWRDVDGRRGVVWSGVEWWCGPPRLQSIGYHPIHQRSAHQIPQLRRQQGKRRLVR